jgi:hypothetical protein
MQTTSYTIERIRDEMIASGSHWWDRDSMRFFGTRCVGPVFQGEGGIYFVTSDKEYDGRRSCNIREYSPDTQEVKTVAGAIIDSDSGDGARLNRIQALRKAQELSGGQQAYATAGYDNTPKVTAAEQLFIDLTRSGCITSLADCRSMVKRAKQHHAQCEEQSNGTRQEVSDTLERVITRLAADMGCKGVKFNGDPRGCTVKLVVPSGATDDIGQEGICVPTN